MCLLDFDKESFSVSVEYFSGFKEIFSLNTVFTCPESRNAHDTLFRVLMRVIHHAICII